MGTLSIVCKAWPVRNGDRFTKHAFTLDWRDQQIHSLILDRLSREILEYSQKFW